MARGSSSKVCCRNATPRLPNSRAHVEHATCPCCTDTCGHPDKLANVMFAFGLKSAHIGWLSSENQWRQVVPPQHGWCCFRSSSIGTTQCAGLHAGTGITLCGLSRFPLTSLRLPMTLPFTPLPHDFTLRRNLRPSHSDGTYCALCWTQASRCRSSSCTHSGKGGHSS